MSVMRSSYHSVWRPLPSVNEKKIISIKIKYYKAAFLDSVSRKFNSADVTPGSLDLVSTHSFLWWPGSITYVLFQGTTPVINLRLISGAPLCSLTHFFVITSTKWIYFVLHYRCYKAAFLFPVSWNSAFPPGIILHVPNLPLQWHCDFVNPILTSTDVSKDSYITIHMQLNTGDVSVRLLFIAVIVHCIVKS